LLQIFILQNGKLALEIAQRGPGPGRYKKKSDFVRIGSRPFHDISPLATNGRRASLPLPDSSLMLPFFLIPGYKNIRPVFPLSFRLVLASYYTVTFALIVQITRPFFLSNMLQFKISIVLLVSAATFLQVTALPLPTPYRGPQ
jgi:hypothetical protein